LVAILDVKHEFLNKSIRQRAKCDTIDTII